MNQLHFIMLFTYFMALVVGVILYVVVTRKSEFVPIKESITLSKVVIFLVCIVGSVLAASIPFMVGYLGSR